MPPLVTFLLGLAGSGKSHTARILERDKHAKRFEGIAARDRTHLIRELTAHLRSGGSCTVEEIAFCCSSNRRQIVALLNAEVPDATIRWMCFENDIESANWNVRNRTDEGKENVVGHLCINAYWTKKYTYPADGEIRPIHRIQEKG